MQPRRELTEEERGIFKNNLKKDPVGREQLQDLLVHDVITTKDSYQVNDVS